MNEGAIYEYLRDWGGSLERMRADYARTVRLEHQLEHIGLADALRLLRLGGKELEL
jgi:hypothetical protein